MIVAVIPARGGSKRIPRKNIKLFAGKPIIAYSILAALETGLFDRVIVSTDDEEIATTAKNYGAEVPFLRPKTLADDFTGTNAVVKHAIQLLLEQDQYFEYVCCIYATAPFVDPLYLNEGFSKLSISKKSFAFSVTSFPYPVQRALRIAKDGSVEALYPENIFKRSQDLEEAYHDAGQFYWGRAKAFLKDKIIFSSDSIPIILPRYLVQDIDTLEDWKRAEMMYAALQMEKRSN
jgi:N-acylneuraminate cytidylyltransferase